MCEFAIHVGQTQKGLGEALDFVGIGVHGPRKAIDKVVNSLKFLS